MLLIFSSLEEHPRQEEQEVRYQNPVSQHRSFYAVAILRGTALRVAWSTQ